MSILVAAPTVLHRLRDRLALILLRLLYPSAARKTFSFGKVFTKEDIADEIAALVAASTRRNGKVLMTPAEAAAMLEAAQADDSADARDSLHQLIDEDRFTADDLRFLLVIATAFWSVRPGSLFQRLRSGPEPGPSSSVAPAAAAPAPGNPA